MTTETSLDGDVSVFRRSIATCDGRIDTVASVSTRIVGVESCINAGPCAYHQQSLKRLGEVCYNQGGSCSQFLKDKNWWIMLSQRICFFSARVVFPISRTRTVFTTIGPPAKLKANSRWYCWSNAVTNSLFSGWETDQFASEPSYHKLA